MILYDTFSVNISMENPKKSKNQSAGISAAWKSKESSILTSREASCSSDYVDNVSTERRFDKFFCSSKNENCSVSDKSTCVKYIQGQDDVKENLDPIRSRMLSHNDTLDNVNLMNNIDDAATMNDSLCAENNSETCLISSDTNLSVLNRTICNTNVDNVTDVPNSGNQSSRVNLEDVQQHKVRDAAFALTEERPGARLFCKKTNRIVHNADFDLNVVNINKSVEKLSQDITVPTGQHTDGDRIGNDHTDDSPTLWNNYKSLDNTNIMRSKINNRNIARVSNIARFNEHNILNKQIDTCDSRKFIQCIALQENSILRNSEARAKNNGFCLKVSIDLCKIQNLIDSKPELFENREHNVNDQRCKTMSRLSNLDEYTRQQVRYYDIESSNNNNCLPKSKLQKSNYIYNVECLQQDAFSDANTFLRYQKSNQEIRNFDKDALDR